MYISRSSNICDLIHLWHFKKAAEIHKCKEQLSPALEPINMPPQPHIPGGNIGGWETGSRLEGC